MTNENGVKVLTDMVADFVERTGELSSCLSVSKR